MEFGSEQELESLLGDGKRKVEDVGRTSRAGVQSRRR